MTKHEVIDLTESLSDVDPEAFEEEQLATAIALSLADLRRQQQESTSPSPSPPPQEKRKDISSTSSSSHASRARSVDPSVVDLSRNSAAVNSNDHDAGASSSSGSAANPTSEFLKERAALEKARLERQKRALAATMDSHMQSQTPGAGPSSAPASAEQRPAKRAKITNSSVSSYTPSVSGYSRQPSQRNEHQMFWDGELRRTPSRFSLGNPTFDLKTIIGDTSDIEWCILSAMEVDFDWVASHLPSHIPTIIACSPSRGTEFAEAAVEELKENFIRCTPRMAPGPGVMHTKVFLLFYKSGRLRVAVNTANLLDFDWWDIENMSWVQDFPPLATTPGTDSTSDSSQPATAASLGAKFIETLATMLTRMNIGAGIRSLIGSKSLSSLPNYTGIEGVLARYDFSAVKVGLVPSIPGTYHAQSGMQSVGHTGLMRVLRCLGARCPPSKKLSLEYQGSSIGKYTADWVRGFQISAEGAMNGYEDWFEMSARKRADLPFPKKEHLKIMFPTLQTVNRVGRQCGGSLFFSPSFWEVPKYPKELFHDARSKSGPILMHTKMMLATFVSEQTAGSSSMTKAGKDKNAVSGINSDVGGWCYVGNVTRSHNFTPSAWGILVRGEKNAAARAAKMTQRTSGERKAAEKKALNAEPHISIRNFELGVVFTLTSNGTSRVADETVCWERPPVPYGIGDNGVPWMQSVHGIGV